MINFRQFLAVITVAAALCWTVMCHADVSPSHTSSTPIVNGNVVEVRNVTNVFCLADVNRNEITASMTPPMTNITNASIASPAPSVWCISQIETNCLIKSTKGNMGRCANGHLHGMTACQAFSLLVGNPCPTTVLGVPCGAFVDMSDCIDVEKMPKSLKKKKQTDVKKRLLACVVTAFVKAGAAEFFDASDKDIKTAVNSFKAPSSREAKEADAASLAQQERMLGNREGVKGFTLPLGNHNNAVVFGR
jgi:hypothetical protein